MNSHTVDKNWNVLDSASPRHLKADLSNFLDLLVWWICTSCSPISFTVWERKKTTTVHAIQTPSKTMCYCHWFSHTHCFWHCGSCWNELWLTDERSSSVKITRCGHFCWRSLGFTCNHVWLEDFIQRSFSIQLFVCITYALCYGIIKVWSTHNSKKIRTVCPASTYYPLSHGCLNGLSIWEYFS